MNSAKKNIRRILDGTHPRYGRAVALGLQFLIIVSVISVAVETLPNLSQNQQDFLFYEERIIISAFIVEYVLRIYSAEKRLSYIISFWGLIDLVAILPALLSVGVDGRSLRVVRLLRVFRLLKIARYTTALDRLVRAFKSVRDEFIIFTAMSMVLLYICAVGIYYFEHETQPEAFPSIVHSLWWAIATLTTVGYGDVYPVTAGGRAFTFIILVVGLALVAIPSGLLASALMTDKAEDSNDTKGD